MEWETVLKLAVLIVLVAGCIAGLVAQWYDEKRKSTISALLAERDFRGTGR